MRIWLDAQLSPALAPWMTETFGVEATPVRECGLRAATDEEIFVAAGKARATVMTKDRDFVSLVLRCGPPPQILGVTCGNTSNARIRQILSQVFETAKGLLDSGESLVEISDQESLSQD